MSVFPAGFVASSWFRDGAAFWVRMLHRECAVHCASGDKSVSTADAVSSVIDKRLAGNCLKNCCPPILASIHGCWYSNYYCHFLFFLFNFWDSVSYDPGCLEFTVAKDDLELLYLLPLSASITGMGHCAQFIGSRILVQGFTLDKHSINWSTAQLLFL